MSAVWGKNIKLTIFGESHGEGIGIVIDGLPSGMELNLEEINYEMQRRAPGQSELSTPRKEKDSFQILSGFFNNKTTGAPFAAVIYNNNTISKDYSEIQYNMRPSHGDYTGFIKYNGFSDYRGGGHFSGRITAPLVLAGAIAKQYLSKIGIIIGSHIYSIGSIFDNSFDKINIDEKLLCKLSHTNFPILDNNIEEKMKNSIKNAKDDKDSIGGIIEAAIVNVPAGIGEPFFDSFESVLSHMLFSIPGVKGVEFGAGFSISSMTGSIANDEYYYENEKVKTYSNNNGGILGGITNSMPIVFRTAFKPTPSIGKKQRTINVETKENVEIEIKGRHDPCIVLRAIPVVEAAASIVMLDYIVKDYK